MQHVAEDVRLIVILCIGIVQPGTPVANMKAIKQGQVDKAGNLILTISVAHTIIFTISEASYNKVSIKQI